MKKWQYLHISKNVIELRDSIFGFNANSKDEVEFLDIELSQPYSRYVPDSSDEIYSMIIDVNNRGVLYERSVWNFEEALGWIGGLIGLIYVFFSSAVSPFMRNSFVFKVMDSSKVA